MKTISLLVVFSSAVLTLTAFGQDQSSQAGTGNRISTTNSSSATSASASATGAAALSFTNKQGQSFSVDQLADQLKNLRSTVDQMMPMLQAFNETYSNSVSGEKTLTGRLSGLLSDSLRRNESATNGGNSVSNQNSGRYGNVVDALQGLLSKNNPNSPPINANTVRDLETLYGQLQPVSSTLQNLNVNIGAGSSSTTNSGSGLTPTGKSSGQQ